LRVKIAVKIRQQPIANVPHHVAFARLVGRPKSAVRNVSRVVQVHLASGVKIVHWDLPENETTILPNANNVKEVQQQQKTARPPAAGVI
jgi:hypothetical protein